MIALILLILVLCTYEKFAQGGTVFGRLEPGFTWDGRAFCVYFPIYSCGIEQSLVFQHITRSLVRNYTILN
jgi:hypothetical protein